MSANFLSGENKSHEHGSSMLATEGQFRMAIQIMSHQDCCGQQKACYGELRKRQKHMNTDRTCSNRLVSYSNPAFAAVGLETSKGSRTHSLLNSPYMCICLTVGILTEGRDPTPPSNPHPSSLGSPAAHYLSSHTHFHASDQK